MNEIPYFQVERMRFLVSDCLLLLAVRATILVYHDYLSGYFELSM